MVSSIIYSIKRGLINGYGLFFDLIFQQILKKSKDGGFKKQILVIKADKIGDFILWTDAGKKYRELFPEHTYSIVLLANRAWANVASATNYFDSVIELDRKLFMVNPFYKFRKLKQLGNLQWHAIYYHAFSHEFAIARPLLTLLSAEQKIGTTSDNSIDSEFWLKRLKAKFTSILTTDLKIKNELQKNESFMQQAGLKNFKASEPDLRFLAGEKSEQLPNNYYIVFPGASSPARMWNAKKFALLCDYIFASTGWTGIIAGGKQEVNLSEIILKNTKADIESFVGKTNLFELLTLVKNARFVISNETSCIHIAAATKTKSICILGGGHFERFLPFPKELISPTSPVCVFHSMNCFHCNWRCQYRISKFQSVPCIENIELENVKKAVDEIVGKNEVTYEE